MPSAGMIEASILATMKRLFKMDSVTGMASVELWVLLTTLLLVVRFVLDCFGPWHADKAMAATIQVIEMLNYSMVHYTLGLMQLSGKRVNDYFQAWAVLLVTLQYSVKTGRPYRKSKQIPLLDLMSSLWAANLLRMQTFPILRIPLWVIWALNAIRIISYFASSDRAATINQENTRLVSDFMRYEHTLGPSGSVDAAAAGGSEDEWSRMMQLYKYLVDGEDLVLHDAQRESATATAQYRIRLDTDSKKLVTIDKIWNVDGGSRLLGGSADTGNRLKDVCLSFAMYKMLRRRFYNLPIHEASQEKTRRLVFDYILEVKTNNYERAFRVTEVALSFLQDLFYSKHAAMFAEGFPIWGILMSLSLAGATGYLAYPVRYIPQRMDQGDKNAITHGVIVTRIMVGLIVAKELSEVYLYVFSKWTKVLMICMYVKHQCLRNPVAEAAMRMVFWFMRGKWNQRIFQCNLLMSYSRNRRPLTRSIKLEPQVKTAIFQSFKGLQNHPERLESYFLNAFSPKNDLAVKQEDIVKQEALVKKLAWAVELEADTHRILVWHVATCLCDMNISAEGEELEAVPVRHQRSRLLAKEATIPADVWPHYLTAVTLSNYCAYLLTRALVPDNGIVVRMVLNAVCRETFETNGRSASQSVKQVYEKLMEIAKKTSKESEEKGVANGVGDELGQVAPDSSVIHEEVIRGQMAHDEENPETHTTGGDATNSSIPATNREDTVAGDGDIHNSIIQMGAKLGKQLIDAHGEGNRVGLWRDLAMFWAGFLLNLAASTRAAKHKTRLVSKGELITHLWVLLSHAGFVGNTRHGQTLLDPHDLDDIDPLS